METGLPVLQPRVQLGVVRAQDEDDVEPALREQVAAVIVDDHAAFDHLFIQLIHHLGDGGWGGVTESQTEYIL